MGGEATAVAGGVLSGSREKGCRRSGWPGEGVGFELSRRRGLLLVLKTKGMKDLVYIGWYVKIV